LLTKRSRSTTIFIGAWAPSPPLRAPPEQDDWPLRSLATAYTPRCSMMKSAGCSPLACLRWFWPGARRCDDRLLLGGSAVSNQCQTPPLARKTVPQNTSNQRLNIYRPAARRNRRISRILRIVVLASSKKAEENSK
jgi:hypothetical protein